MAIDTPQFAFFNALFWGAVFYWFYRRRKKKKEAHIAEQRREAERIAYIYANPSPLAGYDAVGENLDEYINTLANTRSNLNCVLDITFSPYLSEYSLRDIKRIRGNLKVIQESCDIIRKSNKSETIISRFGVIMTHLNSLVREFNLPSAYEKIEIANSLQSKIYVGAYFKDIQNALLKIDSLKIEKSKQKYYSHISELIDKISLIEYIPSEEIVALRRFCELHA